MAGLPDGLSGLALVRDVLPPPDAWKRYPYPFLDVARFGYSGVALMALALAVCFVLLGYGLIDLHRLVNQASRTAAVSPPSSPADTGSFTSKTDLRRNRY